MSLEVYMCRMCFSRRARCANMCSDKSDKSPVHIPHARKSFRPTRDARLEKLPSAPKPQGCPLHDNDGPVLEIRYNKFHAPAALIGRTAFTNRKDTS